MITDGCIGMHWEYICLNVWGILGHPLQNELSLLPAAPSRNFRENYVCNEDSYFRDMFSFFGEVKKQFLQGFKA